MQYSGLDELGQMRSGSAMVEPSAEFMPRQSAATTLRDSGGTSDTFLSSVDSRQFFEQPRDGTGKKYMGLDSMADLRMLMTPSSVQDTDRGSYV